MRLSAAVLAIVMFPAIATFRAAPLHAQSAPMDTTDLGSGPHSRMHMLLEKTLFKVDVLILDVRFGPLETDRIDALLGGLANAEADDATAHAPLSAQQLRDSVAVVGLEARNVWARIEFRRNVKLDQFLGGIRDNLRRATQAEVITVQNYRSISADLPEWYAFLEERGIHSRDQMFYRIRGDTLRTVFVTVDGETLLDQVDVGPERRLSVLGGYFAPGSDFRDKLVDSLLSGA